MNAIVRKLFAKKYAPLPLLVRLRGAAVRTVQVVVEWSPSGIREEKASHVLNGMVLIPWQHDADSAKVVLVAGERSAAFSIDARTNCYGNAIDLELRDSVNAA